MQFQIKLWERFYLECIFLSFHTEVTTLEIIPRRQTNDRYTCKLGKTSKGTPGQG